jgi:hypothetical protein
MAANAKAMRVTGLLQESDGVQNIAILTLGELRRFFIPSDKRWTLGNVKVGQRVDLLHTGGTVSCLRLAKDGDPDRYGSTKQTAGQPANWKSKEIIGIVKNRETGKIGIDVDGRFIWFFTGNLFTDNISVGQTVKFTQNNGTLSSISPVMPDSPVTNQTPTTETHQTTPDGSIGQTSITQPEPDKGLAKPPVSEPVVTKPVPVTIAIPCMAKVLVTINLTNYESLRIGVEGEVKCPDDYFELVKQLDSIIAYHSSIAAGTTAGMIDAYRARVFRGGDGK